MSQLNSAVRAFPTCSCPVGLGANLTRINRYGNGPRTTTSQSGTNWTMGYSRCSQQRHGMRRDRFAAPDRVDPFVGLPLHADPLRGNSECGRKPRLYLGNEWRNLRPLEDNADVDVLDRETARDHMSKRIAQQHDAGGILPFRIG